jgi:hypothetical protein
MRVAVYDEVYERYVRLSGLLLAAGRERAGGEPGARGGPERAADERVRASASPP